MFDNFKKLFRRPITPVAQKADTMRVASGHQRPSWTDVRDADGDARQDGEGNARYEEGAVSPESYADFVAARRGDARQETSGRHQAAAQEPQILALAAPGTGRQIDFDAANAEQLSTAELTVATSAMRSDILARAKTAALNEGGAGRQQAIRISAMEKAAGVAAKETFVSSGILSLDKNILETVPFASDEDRERMGQLAQIGQTRHDRDMTKLRAEMREQGFNLHEVASLKNPTWLHSQSTPKDPKSAPRFSKGEIVSMATSQNSTARTSAALKEAILGRLDESKPDRDYLVIATPIDRNVNQQQFEAGLRMRRADTRLGRELGSVAPNADDLRRNGLMAVSTSNPMSAPAAMKTAADKKRRLGALQAPQR